MPDQSMQVDIFGGETPHKEVVKKQRPPKRKAIPLAEIQILAQIISDLEVDAEECQAIADKFLAHLLNVNSRLKAEDFYRWCGL